MTEFSEQELQSLRDKLSRLAAADETYDGPLRQLGVKRGDRVRAAILAEIDDCILPVNISFVRSGIVLGVLAAGRRLLSVTYLKVDSDAENFDGSFFGSQLSPEDMEGLIGVRTCIDLFVRHKGAVFVHYDRANTQGSETIGLSVEQVRDALESKELLKSAKAAAKPASAPKQSAPVSEDVVVRAKIAYRKGEISQSEGPKHLIKLLVILTEGKLIPYLDSRTKELATSPENFSVYFGGLVADEASVGVVVEGEQLTVYLMDLASEAAFHSLMRQERVAEVAS